MKTINMTFADKEFRKLNRIKRKHNLTWEVFFIKAIEALIDLEILEKEVITQ